MAVVTRRASDAVRAGAVWVYRSEVVEVRPGAGEAEVAPGSGGDGGGWARAFRWEPRCIARLRKLRCGWFRGWRGWGGPGIWRMSGELGWGGRCDLREEVAPVSAENDACRLVFCGGG